MNPVTVLYLTLATTPVPLGTTFVDGTDHLTVVDVVRRPYHELVPARIPGTVNSWVGRHWFDERMICEAYVCENQEGVPCLLPGTVVWLLAPKQDLEPPARRVRGCPGGFIPRN